MFIISYLIYVFFSPPQMGWYGLLCLLGCLIIGCRADLQQAAVTSKLVDMKVVRAKALFSVNVNKHEEFSEELFASAKVIFQTLNKKILKLNHEHVTDFVIHSMNVINISMSEIKTFMTQHPTTPSEEGKLGNRSKRALVNVGGQILKAVFGTATTDDINTLTNNFKNLTEEVKITKMKITLESTKIKRVFKSLLRTMKSQGKIYETLLKKFSDAQHIMFVFTQLKTIISYLSTAIQDYKNTLNTIYTHHVPTIFTRDQIIHIFETAEKYYPDYTIPLNTSVETIETLHQYMEIVQAQQPFTYTLMVPLVEKNTYALFETAAMPIRNQLGNMLKISNLERFIGISNEKFFTSEKPLNKCKVFKTFKVCEAPLKLVDNDVKNNCALNILHNNTKACTFEPWSINGKIYATRLSNAWFIYLDEPVPAELTCNKEKISKQFVGLMKVAPQCFFRTDDITLASISTSIIQDQITPRNHIASEVIPAQMTFVNETQLGVYEKQLNSINDDLNKMLNITQTNITTLYDHKENTILHSKIIYGGLSITTILIGMMLIIGLLALKKYSTYKPVIVAKETAIPDIKLLMRDGTM